VSKDEIIRELTANPEYKELCKKIRKDGFCDDLHQEILISLLEMPSDRAEKIICLRCYIAKMIYSSFNQYAPFHKTYIKPSEPVDTITETYDPTIDQRAKQIEKMLMGEDEIDRTFFYAYLREGTYRKAAKKIGVDFTTIHKSVQKTRQKIRERL